MVSVSLATLLINCFPYGGHQSSHQMSSEIALLDALAVNRDVAGLRQYLVGSSSSNPFQIIATGGAYDVGKFGWHAVPLETVDGKHLVVFTTPLTVEDTGELVFERLGSKLRYLPETDDLGVLVKKHSFDLRFVPAEKEAILRDAISFKRKGSSGKAYLIRMSPCYKVTSVTKDGSSVPFRQSAGVVSLPMPEGESDFTYDIEYKGLVKLAGYAAAIGPKEATLTNDYWYPTVARHPAAYDITVHSPKGWIAVGQGEQVAMSENATERITKFRMDLPVTYYSVSAAPYKTVTVPVNGKNYSVWSLHLDEARMRDQALFYAPIIETYEKWFGKFPFSGYGAVISDSYGSGALEAYSFATWGSAPGEDAHEPAHTWFGGQLDNTYLHSFWDESFADYCDDLFHRHSPIGKESARELAFVAEAKPSPDWDKAAVETAGADAGPVADSLGYGKGSYVLAMLEQELGTDMMIRSLRQWVADRPEDRGAEWADFEGVVAKVTGKDYGWFWDQWLRMSGTADFGVQQPQWDGHNLTGIASLMINHWTAGYAPSFEMLVTYADGREELIKVHHPDNWEGSSKSFPFSVPCSSKPVRISVDPYRKLLRMIQADEAPPSIRRFHATNVFREAANANWRPEFKASLQQLPNDLNGVAIVATPESLPAIQPLCGKIGLSVKGDVATYNGTRVKLSEGTVTAIVDLGSGKQCLLAMGTSRWPIDFGHSSICLSDVLGRFLDGRTEPKRIGNLTFDIP